MEFYPSGFHASSDAADPVSPETHLLLQLQGKLPGGLLGPLGPLADQGQRLLVPAPLLLALLLRLLRLLLQGFLPLLLLLAALLQPLPPQTGKETFLRLGLRLGAKGWDRTWICAARWAFSASILLSSDSKWLWVDWRIRENSPEVLALSCLGKKRDDEAGTPAVKLLPIRVRV